MAALPRAEATSTPPEMPLLDALRFTPRGFSTWIRVSPGPARVSTARRRGLAGIAAERDVTRAPEKAEPRAAVTVLTAGAKADMTKRDGWNDARVGVMRAGARRGERASRGTRPSDRLRRRDRVRGTAPYLRASNPAS